MKTIHLLVILFLVPFYVFSQTPLSIKKGRLNTKDGELIKFSRLTQNADGFSYYPTGINREKIIATDNVLKVEKKSGDNALLFGVIMGASGLLGAYLGTKLAESNLESQGMIVDKKTQTTTIIVITGVSALIGVIWGANQPKYKKVYENPKYAGFFNRKIQFYFTIDKTNQIGFLYRF